VCDRTARLHTPTDNGPGTHVLQRRLEENLAKKPGPRPPF
jgi:hypothetical protein